MPDRLAHGGVECAIRESAELRHYARKRKEPRQIAHAQHQRQGAPLPPQAHADIGIVAGQRRLQCALALAAGEQRGQIILALQQGGQE